MDNLGLTEEELLPVDMREPQSVLPRPALPPFNGYGTLQVRAGAMCGAAQTQRTPPILLPRRGLRGPATPRRGA